MARRGAWRGSARAGALPGRGPPRRAPPPGRGRLLLALALLASLAPAAAAGRASGGGGPGAALRGSNTGTAPGPLRPQTPDLRPRISADDVGLFTGYCVPYYDVVAYVTPDEYVYVVFPDSCQLDDPKLTVEAVFYDTVTVALTPCVLSPYLWAGAFPFLLAHSLFSLNMNYERVTFRHVMPLSFVNPSCFYEAPLHVQYYGGLVHVHPEAHPLCSTTYDETFRFYLLRGAEVDGDGAGREELPCGSNRNFYMCGLTPEQHADLEAGVRAAVDIYMPNGSFVRRTPVEVGESHCLDPSQPAGSASSRLTLLASGYVYLQWNDGCFSRLDSFRVEDADTIPLNGNYLLGTGCVVSGGGEGGEGGGDGGGGDGSGGDDGGGGAGGDTENESGRRVGVVFPGTRAAQAAPTPTDTSATPSTSTSPASPSPRDAADDFLTCLSPHLYAASLELREGDQSFSGTLADIIARSSVTDMTSRRPCYFFEDPQVVRIRYAGNAMVVRDTDENCLDLEGTVIVCLTEWDRGSRYSVLQPVSDGRGRRLVTYRLDLEGLNLTRIALWSPLAVAQLGEGEFYRVLSEILNERGTEKGEEAFQRLAALPGAIVVDELSQYYVENALDGSTITHGCINDRLYVYADNDAVTDPELRVPLNFSVTSGSQMTSVASKILQPCEEDGVGHYSAEVGSCDPIFFEDESTPLSLTATIEQDLQVVVFGSVGEWYYSCNILDPASQFTGRLHLNSVYLSGRCIPRALCYFDSFTQTARQLVGIGNFGPDGEQLPGKDGLYEFMLWDVETEMLAANIEFYSCGRISRTLSVELDDVQSCYEQLQTAALTAVRGTVPGLLVDIFSSAENVPPSEVSSGGSGGGGAEARTRTVYYLMVSLANRGCNPHADKLLIQITNNQGVVLAEQEYMDTDEYQYMIPITLPTYDSLQGGATVSIFYVYDWVTANFTGLRAVTGRASCLEVPGNSRLMVLGDSVTLLWFTSMSACIVPYNRVVLELITLEGEGDPKGPESPDNPDESGDAGDAGDGGGSNDILDPSDPSDPTDPSDPEGPTGPSDQPDPTPTPKTRYTLDLYASYFKTLEGAPTGARWAVASQRVARDASGEEYVAVEQPLEDIDSLPLNSNFAYFNGEMLGSRLTAYCAGCTMADQVMDVTARLLNGTRLYGGRFYLANTFVDLNSARTYAYTRRVRNDILPEVIEVCGPLQPGGCMETSVDYYGSSCLVQGMLQGYVRGNVLTVLPDSDRCVCYSDAFSVFVPVRRAGRTTNIEIQVPLTETMQGIGVFKTSLDDEIIAVLEADLGDSVQLRVQEVTRNTVTNNAVRFHIEHILPPERYAPLIVLGAALAGAALLVAAVGLPACPRGPRRRRGGRGGRAGSASGSSGSPGASASTPARATDSEPPGSEAFASEALTSDAPPSDPRAPSPLAPGAAGGAEAPASSPGSSGPGPWPNASLSAEESPARR